MNDVVSLTETSLEPQCPGCAPALQTHFYPPEVTGLRQCPAEEWPSCLHAASLAAAPGVKPREASSPCFLPSLHPARMSVNGPALPASSGTNCLTLEQMCSGFKRSLSICAYP